MPRSSRSPATLQDPLGEPDRSVNRSPGDRLLIDQIAGSRRHFGKLIHVVVALCGVPAFHVRERGQQSIQIVDIARTLLSREDQRRLDRRFRCLLREEFRVARLKEMRGAAHVRGGSQILCRVQQPCPRMAQAQLSAHGRPRPRSARTVRRKKERGIVPHIQSAR